MRTVQDLAVHISTICRGAVGLRRQFISALAASVLGAARRGAASGRAYVGRRGTVAGFAVPCLAAQSRPGPGLGGVGLAAALAAALGLAFAAPAGAQSAMPPMAMDDQFEFTASETIRGNVLANDIDPDGDSLSLGHFWLLPLPMDAETSDLQQPGASLTLMVMDDMEMEMEIGTLSLAATGVFTLTPHENLMMLPLGKSVSVEVGYYANDMESSPAPTDFETDSRVATLTLTVQGTHLTAARLATARNRNLEEALGGIAQSVSWNVVEGVRRRVALDTAANRVDMSGLTGLAERHLAKHSVKHSVDGRESHNALAFGGDPIDGLRLPEPAVASASASLGLGSAIASHAIASQANGGELAPDNMRLWTAITSNDISFQPDHTVDFDGDTLFVQVGAEFVLDSGLLGVAIGRLDGEMVFRDTAQNGVGEVEVTQWVVQPYASYETDTARIWGTFGLGLGEMDYRDNYAAATNVGEADSWMRLAAGGVEFDISSYKELNLVGRVEGVTSQISADADDSANNLFRGQSGDGGGVRGELELGWDFDQTTVRYRPYLTAGYRWDFGNSGSQGVLEYGTGLTVRGGALTLDASARSQTGADDEGFDLSSYTINLGYDRGGDGMGLTLNLSNSLGASNSPFGQSVPAGLGSGDDRQLLSLEAGYGMGVRLGVLTPHAEASFDDGALSKAALGLRLSGKRGGVKLLHSLRLARPGAGVIADKHTADKHTADEQALLLQLDLRF